MATGNLITYNGKKVLLYRTYTANGDLSATQYLAPTKFGLGLNNRTPLVSSEQLSFPIPISVGTVIDDGATNMTGSTGGDNSTDNTTTFKIGAALADDTSQNLIANDTAVAKYWLINPTSPLGSATQPFGINLYIKDTTTLVKFKTSGTATEVRYGSDVSNYYLQEFEASDLSVGWNWLSSNTTNLGDLTEIGTVAGNIDYFVIKITTNIATDTFVAGDVLFDLARQWTDADTKKDFAAGYPIFDYTDFELHSRFIITGTEASGFDIDGLGVYNEDTEPLMVSENTFDAEEKLDTSQWRYTIVDRLI